MKSPEKSCESAAGAFRRGRHLLHCLARRFRCGRAGVWAVIASLACIAPLHAGGGPENVAVVINQDSFASKAVANAFIRLRQVPAGNAIYLSLGDLPDFETVDVNTFRERILRPVLATLKSRDLASQIDCVAYSSDIPYAIRVSADVGQQELPKVITPTASVTGLTYLSSLVLFGNPQYLSLGVNAYARLPAQFTISGDTEWTEQQQAKFAEAVQQFQEQEYQPAVETLQSLADTHPKVPTLWYNLALARLKLSREEQALEALQKAVECGWRDVQRLQTDEDLASLRDREEFKQLVRRLESQPVILRPTLAFRSSVGWNAQGLPVPVDQGMPYLLSTMLSVTSGRGLSVTEAIAHLRRSVAADGTSPPGTIYLMDNNDVRSRTRKPMFEDTVQFLNQTGVRAEIVKGKLPAGRDDVMGLVAGSATFDWPSSGSKIRAGAICEHLTSTGGVMHERGGQTPLTEFLRHGAAASSGTVTEPYAITAKFPLPYMHLHYARGCSVAEAFYQSVSGPYQLLIVGDPLCAPWARKPTVQQPDREEGPLSGSWTFQPQGRAAAGTAIGRYDLFVDGKQAASCRAGESITLDTTTLADGEHEFRLVAIQVDPVQAQGRVLWSAPVNNGGRSLELRLDGPIRRDLDARLTLHATMDGVTRVHLRHQGRILTKAGRSDGSFQVDAAELGLGTAEITAYGFADGSRPAAISRPVQVSITEPPPAAAIEPPADVDWKPGIAVCAPERDPEVVSDTTSDRWLEDLDVPSDKPFWLRAYFDVPSDDLYQFQLRSPRDVTLMVDDRVLLRSQSSRWKYIPVSLKQGNHRLRVHVSGPGPPQLQLRFGGPGSRRISGRVFHTAG